METSNTNNSILPDDTSGNGNDTSLRDNRNMTKSVSAIQGLVSEKTDSSNETENAGQGVPIKNFDALVANLESLNIKFFN
ncbi:MAG: hypothetical protein PUB54_03795 [Lachnospiraceae bacterium]|nr:hypothetical protein [Lachnospiraceae bacterium]